MAALLLALAVGALALDDAPESSKSMIKDGVDGRRLGDTSPTNAWSCNVFRSETQDLDACAINGGLAVTFPGGVMEVTCFGTVVPDGASNSLYHPADGDACPSSMVPADQAACELVASPQCAGPSSGREFTPGPGPNGIFLESTGQCEPMGGQLAGQCYRRACLGCGEIVYNTLPCTTTNTDPDYQAVCMNPPPSTIPPTASPTANPTPYPTADPTAKPTADPTAKPTADPTASPTLSPTFNPTPDQYEPLRVATADLSTKINSASTYEEAKVQVKVVKKLTKKLPACASPYKEMLRKNTNQLLRRIRKKKAWSDLAGRLTTIMNLQDNLQACA